MEKEDLELLLIYACAALQESGHRVSPKCHFRACNCGSALRFRNAYADFARELAKLPAEERKLFQAKIDLAKQPS